MSKIKQYLNSKFRFGGSRMPLCNQSQMTIQINEKQQEKIVAYCKAMVKVFLLLGIALLAIDCMAKTEVADAFETGIGKFDGLIGRGIYTIGGCLVAGGGILAWKAQGDAIKAGTPIVFGLGLPVAYEFMGKVHTLLI